MGRISGSQHLVKVARWRELLSQHRLSGVSVRAFCASEGLTEQQFYYWKRVISADDRRGAAALTDSSGSVVGQQATGDASPRWVPIHVVPRFDRAAAGSAPLEVAWPQGIVLRTSDQVDSGALLRAMQAVEAILSGAQRC